MPMSLIVSSTITCVTPVSSKTRYLIEPRQAARAEQRVGVVRPVADDRNTGALQQARPGVVIEDAVAGDAHVDHAWRLVAIPLPPATAQEVGPAAIKVWRRARSIGDRTPPEGDDCSRRRSCRTIRRRAAGTATAGTWIQPAAWRRPHHSPLPIDSSSPARRSDRSSAMSPPSPHPAGRGHSQVAERLHGDRYRIAQSHRPGLDRHRGLPAERERAARSLYDRRSIGAQGDVAPTAMRSGFGSEPVRQRNADLGTADARPDDLTHRLVRNLSITGNAGFAGCALLEAGAGGSEIGAVPHAPTQRLSQTALRRTTGALRS